MTSCLALADASQATSPGPHYTLLSVRASHLAHRHPPELHAPARAARVLRARETRAARRPAGHGRHRGVGLGRCDSSTSSPAIAPVYYVLGNHDYYRLEHRRRSAPTCPAAGCRRCAGPAHRADGAARHRRLGRRAMRRPASTDPAHRLAVDRRVRAGTLRPRSTHRSCCNELGAGRGVRASASCSRAPGERAAGRAHARAAVSRSVRLRRRAVGARVAAVVHVRRDRRGARRVCARASDQADPVLCGHSHGAGVCHPEPNLEVRTGGWPPGIEGYGNPIVQATLELYYSVVAVSSARRPLLAAQADTDIRAHSRFDARAVSSPCTSGIGRALEPIDRGAERIDARQRATRTRATVQLGGDLTQLARSKRTGASSFGSASDSTVASTLVRRAAAGSTGCRLAHLERRRRSGAAPRDPRRPIRS